VAFGAAIVGRTMGVPSGGHRLERSRPSVSAGSHCCRLVRQVSRGCRAKPRSALLSMGQGTTDEGGRDRCRARPGGGGERPPAVLCWCLWRSAGPGRREYTRELAPKVGPVISSREVHAVDATGAPRARSATCSRRWRPSRVRFLLGLVLVPGAKVLGLRRESDADLEIIG
jgi:hypothetical protein